MYLIGLAEKHERQTTMGVGQLHMVFMKSLKFPGKKIKCGKNNALESSVMGYAWEKTAVFFLNFRQRIARFENDFDNSNGNDID